MAETPQTQGHQVYADIEQTRETWLLDVPTLPRVAVIRGKRAGVTLSGTPGMKKSVTVAGITISGLPVGDNGQGDLISTVHTTGVFEFPIVGATAATPRGTAVYFVEADGSLTVTKVDDATTPFFGEVEFPEGYIVRGTTLPIRIGVTH